MEKTYKLLYDALQSDLLQCMEKQFDIIREIECCFQISTHYWNELRQRMLPYEFNSVADEVSFYKKWKPLFTSEIRYYELLYTLNILHPELTEMTKNHFLREQQRLEKFIWEHTDFYEYYKSGESSHDVQYFLRTIEPMREFSVQYFDEKLRSPQDHLVTEIIALERYIPYINEKLQQHN